MAVGKKMILDKLMEKKDLLTFIKSRVKKLKIAKGRTRKIPEIKRYLAFKQIDGRIKELEYIKKNINKLKEISKKNWE